MVLEYIYSKLRVLASGKLIPLLFVVFAICIIHEEYKFLLNKIPITEIHQDESQHVHIAWNILKGKVIYKDFWEHHGPLTAWVNGLVLKSLRGEVASFQTFFILRYWSVLVFSVSSVFVVLSVYFLSGNLAAGFLALPLMFATTVFQNEIFKLRPEIYIGLFFLVWFFLWLKNKRFFSGVVLGVCLAFHTKFFPTNLIVLIFDLFLFFPRSRSTRSILNCFSMALGQSLTCFLVIIVLWLQGSLMDGYQTLLAHNFELASKRLSVESVQYLYKTLPKSEALLFQVLGGLILVLVFLFFLKRRQVSNPIKMGFILMISFLVFLTSPVWNYSLIMFLPVLIVLVVSFIALIPWNRVLSLGLLATLIWRLWGETYKIPQTNSSLLETQRESVQLVLTQTTRETPIFYVWASRCPAYVFNADFNKWWANMPYVINLDPMVQVNRFEDLGIRWVAIETSYMNGIYRIEKAFLENKFERIGCLWKRK